MVKKWREKDQVNLWNILVPKLLALGDVPEQEAREDVATSLSNVYLGIWPVTDLGEDEENEEECDEVEEEEETEEPGGAEETEGAEPGEGNDNIEENPPKEENQRPLVIAPRHPPQATLEKVWAQLEGIQAALGPLVREQNTLEGVIRSRLESGEIARRRPTREEVKKRLFTPENLGSKNQKGWRGSVRGRGRAEPSPSEPRTDRAEGSSVSPSRRRRSRRARGRRRRVKSDSSESGTSSYESEVEEPIFGDLLTLNIRERDRIATEMLQIWLHEHRSVSGYVRSLDWDAGKPRKKSSSRSKREALTLARALDFGLQDYGFAEARKMNWVEVLVRRLWALDEVRQGSGWDVATQLEEIGAPRGKRGVTLVRNALKSVKLSKDLASLRRAGHEDESGAGER